MTIETTDIISSIGLFISIIGIGVIFGSIFEDGWRVYKLGVLVFLIGLTLEAIAMIGLSL